MTITPEQAPAVLRFCEAVFKACPWLYDGIPPTPAPATRPWRPIDRATEDMRRMAKEKGCSAKEKENLERIFEKARDMTPP